MQVIVVSTNAILLRYSQEIMSQLSDLTKMNAVLNAELEAVRVSCNDSRMTKCENHCFVLI